MSRANDNDVRAIIDYDTDKPLVSMQPFIRAASVLVDKIEANDTSSILNSDALKEVETWLAAHFYAHKDLQYKSAKAMDAGAVFQVGQDGLGPLELTMWGRQAMLLDMSGYLSKLNQDAIRGKSKITLSWLGKPPSSQIDYVDRD